MYRNEKKIIKTMKVERRKLEHVKERKKKKEKRFFCGKCNSKIKSVSFLRLIYLSSAINICLSMKNFTFGLHEKNV